MREEALGVAARVQTVAEPVGYAPARHGLVVLQGNRMEDLRDLTLQWLGLQPLHPLARTVFLVQSNGIAQWLKTSIAELTGEDGGGICLGVDVLLPARFQWQAYRAVIEVVEGVGRLPVTSLFDKSRLRWRLLAHLTNAQTSPLRDPLFAPLARYLGDDPTLQKHDQLAERLADLFDQYQVYRADWLNAWESGNDVLPLPDGQQRGLPDDQRWQPVLWRQILAGLPPDERCSHRGAVHRRFLEAVRQLNARPAGLPERVVIIGICSLPQQTLEVLATLSAVCEVVLALHNPCRYYWGEIIETQEALRQHARHRRRQGMPPDLHLTPERLHTHAHPLLAAWGKQGRDYLQLLSLYDQTHLEEMQNLLGRSVDFFEPPKTNTLLGQLQEDILELRPLHESRDLWPPVDLDSDRSIRFHRCHSPHRELEVLHDQLLAAFADTTATDTPLQPRDIIVMVPDINTYAPFIDAVFGQFTLTDPRYLPYHVTDQQTRRREPLLVALDTLLTLPMLRVQVSDILNLLDIAPLRQRFGIAESDLPTLQRWIRETNIRWGIDVAQRAELKLPVRDALHTWRFGLERMLLGYAIGENGTQNDWANVVPYAEVTGLDAALAGSLYRLIVALADWRKRLHAAHTAQDWGQQLRALLDAMLCPASSAEQTVLERIQDALEDWQDAVSASAPDLTLPLSVVRESLFERIDTPQLAQRFLLGRITFATLMPMRAIPYRYVALLGMNDGDYPRRVDTVDFDLMALRTAYRAGDRSRRDDDRYLFLEALLSAREQLSISWCGNSPRDNAEQPPSVLVGQLRDHLCQGWRLAQNNRTAGAAAGGAALLEALTSTHPLQPFGAAYFRAESPLVTYAHEWQTLHPQEKTLHASRAPKPVTEPLPAWQPAQPLTIADLVALLHDPIHALFERRLGTRMIDEDVLSDDEEPFVLDGLAQWHRRNALVQPLARQLIHEVTQPEAAMVDIRAALAAAQERDQRAGHYPSAPVGTLLGEQVRNALDPMLGMFRTLLQRYPCTADPARSVFDSGIVLANGRSTLQLADAVRPLYAKTSEPDAERCYIVLLASRLNTGNTWAWRHILRHWPAHLLLQCVYPETDSHLVSPTRTLRLPGLPAAAAHDQLRVLLQYWHTAMHKILPTQLEIACLLLESKMARSAPDTSLRELAVGNNTLYDACSKAWEQQSAHRPLLLRHFATLDALLDAEEFDSVSRALYAPAITVVCDANAANDANAATATPEDLA